MYNICKEMKLNRQKTDIQTQVCRVRREIMMNIRLDEKKLFLDRIRQSLKKLNNLLSLSKIPLQLAAADGQIMVELNSSPDFCKRICQSDPDHMCEDYHKRCVITGDTITRFTCHCGLYNFVIPISTRAAEPPLFLLGGQIYEEQCLHHKYMLPVGQLAASKNLTPEEVARSVGRIQSMAQAQITTYERMAQYIAHNLTEDLKTTDTHTNRLSLEKEILERKIIDLETKNSFLVVNPHFLFNTLNTIARVAYYEKSRKTEELIYCLSDLLRYNLKQDNELHPLSEELENIKKYLYIQKIRFKDRLEYEINIPDEMQQYRIPNMILQPLVENALLHGITPKCDGGRIRITAKKQGNDITLYVSDNGYGFPQEILDLIADGDFSRIKTQAKSGIGLLSTHNRIQHYFGAPYGLTVKQSDFSGTTIAICIPIRQ